MHGCRRRCLGNDLLSREIERCCQGLIQFRQLVSGKSSDVISEHRLEKADKLVAMNCTIVFQPFVDTDRYRRLTTKKPSICAGRQVKDAGPGTTHLASRNDLVLENILCFSIQLVSELVDPSHLVLES